MQTRGGGWGPLRVKSAVLTPCQPLPVCPQLRTFLASGGMSQMCQKQTWSRALFLPPALHQKLVDDGGCRVFEMLRQSLPVVIQLCIIEHTLGNNLVTNRIDERDEMRAAIIA